MRGGPYGRTKNIHPPVRGGEGESQLQEEKIKKLPREWLDQERGGGRGFLRFNEGKDAPDIRPGKGAEKTGYVLNCWGASENYGRKSQQI